MNLTRVTQETENRGTSLHVGFQAGAVKHENYAHMLNFASTMLSYRETTSKMLSVTVRSKLDSNLDFKK